VAGIICSLVARRRASTGDIDGALRMTRLAKNCCLVSLVLGVLLYVLIAAGAVHLPASSG
jgi:hypothetical protein